VNIISLNNRQYCIVVNPVDESGKPSWGERKLIKGEASFFLRPGERLENNKIENIIVLGEDETLLLKAKESFVEGKEKHRAGDVWLIKGPCDYLPPVEVEVLKQRKIIPLDEGEGIYIRDLETGKVRAEIGKSYMLKANEELWEKELSDVVENLLSKTGGSEDKKQVSTVRDKTRVVTYRAAFGSAVQVYDYKHKKSRIIFGPDLVTLQPDEEFTVLSLSGGVPLKENEELTLALNLGPGNMSDKVEVETSDHARLRLLLSYKWKFDFDKNNEVERAKIFSIGDFIGISCRSMASRIRAAVASCPFEKFHKNSAEIIKAGVFGVDKETNLIRETAFFKSNNLLINGVDVQAVEPIDQRTVDALQKSVQLAIEITTQSKEETHRHNARKKDQIAQGKLERQKLQDEIEAEKKRTELVRLKCSTEIVKRIGELTSEAYAKFESAKIEGKTLVEQSTHQAKAHIIQEESSIEEERLKQEQIRNHLRKLNDLEIQKSRELSNIECKKFEQIVEAIGSDTIESMAKAGPEMQTKLLQGLGLQGFIITDGNNPINLFNTANNLTQVSGVNNNSGPKIEENVKDEDF
jgi:major vault protein